MHVCACTHCAELGRAAVASAVLSHRFCVPRRYFARPDMASYVVKWSGSEYTVIVDDTQTVADLKNVIFNKTGVRQDRQKLLGLKAAGKAATDETVIADLNLKPHAKIMLMGSREEDIAQASERPADLPEVVNDLDIPEEAEIAIQNQSEYLAKIEKRVRDIKVEMLNQPRPGKKLLVLDIDYTLFDHRSVAESPDQLMRPYLHEFLTAAYDDYDIVIWCKSIPSLILIRFPAYKSVTNPPDLQLTCSSTRLTAATSMKWIQVKMRQLGVTLNPNYRITFMLDSSSMICVHSPEYGFLDVSH